MNARCLKMVFEFCLSRHLRVGNLAWCVGALSWMKQKMSKPKLPPPPMIHTEQITSTSAVEDTFCAPLSSSFRTKHRAAAPYHPVYWSPLVKQPSPDSASVFKTSITVLPASTCSGQRCQRERTEPCPSGFKGGLTKTDKATTGEDSRLTSLTALSELNAAVDGCRHFAMQARSWANRSSPAVSRAALVGSVEGSGCKQRPSCCPCPAGPVRTCYHS